MLVGGGGGVGVRINACVVARKKLRERWSQLCPDVLSQLIAEQCLDTPQFDFLFLSMIEAIIDLLF
jgi:hypothetical protein